MASQQQHRTRLSSLQLLPPSLIPTSSSRQHRAHSDSQALQRSPLGSRHHLGRAPLDRQAQQQGALDRQQAQLRAHLGRHHQRFLHQCRLGSLSLQPASRPSSSSSQHHSSSGPAPSSLLRHHHPSASQQASRKATWRSTLCHHHCQQPHGQQLPSRPQPQQQSSLCRYKVGILAQGTRSC